MAAPSGICLKAGVFIRMMTLFKKSNQHSNINPRQPRSLKNELLAHQPNLKDIFVMKNRKNRADRHRVIVKFQFEFEHMLTKIVKKFGLHSSMIRKIVKDNRQDFKTCLCIPRDLLSMSRRPPDFSRHLSPRSLFL